LWFLRATAIDRLLKLAHTVASARGALALLPSMPVWAFAAMVCGGVWLCLWTTRVRVLGLASIAAGAIGAMLAPTPDLLITGDGRHLAVVDNGVPLILRDRAGDYVRSLFAEASGFDGDPDILDGQPASNCSHDACVAVLRTSRAEWRLMATRSATRIDWDRITAACGAADVVVSDRRLPRACEPRWLKLDPEALSRTGGLAIYLRNSARVASVADQVGAHPWAQAVLSDQYRRIKPARRPWIWTRRGS
jgi:competence protein ComEC